MQGAWLQACFSSFSTIRSLSRSILLRVLFMQSTVFSVVSPPVIELPSRWPHWKIEALCNWAPHLKRRPSFFNFQLFVTIWNYNITFLLASIRSLKFGVVPCHYKKRCFHSFLCSAKEWATRKVASLKKDVSHGSNSKRRFSSLPFKRDIIHHAKQTFARFRIEAGELSVTDLDKDPWKLSFNWVFIWRIFK